jgi:outer membrane protein assembly factor BamE (lipoprotein component of BamABCDE complex)
LTAVHPMMFSSSNHSDEENVMKTGLVQLPLLAAATLLVAGCSATQHRNEVQDDSADRITVGTVQREIRVGMTSAEVAGILGAPNIVSTDAERREVWIWDKISSEVSYSRSSGVIAGLVIGSSGGGAGGGSKNAGAASSSQRTLTVIVKFDESDRVRDFSYRTSSF